MAGDVHRASSSAFTTTDAATGQVHCSQDVPIHISMSIGLNRDPLRLVALNGTPCAIAHRTSLAASIALDAF